ncbi:MAG: response regulator transcription factor [Eggerthellaceae bacterium]
MIYLLLFATIALMARLSSASKPRETMTSEESMARACAIASKRHGLTPRESEILRYLVKGYDRGFVAQSLSVSSETVKSHTRHIYEKLGAHTRLELFNAVARCLDEEAGA